jgi:hypothetical protein
MAVSPNNLFTSGQILTAQECNQFPFGVLGYTQSTSLYSTVAPNTTYQDVGMSASVTYLGNRLLEMTYSTQVIPNGGVQGVVFKFLRGSTAIKEFEITSSVFPNTSNAFYLNMSAIFAGPATGATETFKVQIKTAAANTTVLDYGAGSLTRDLVIKDLGPI